MTVRNHSDVLVIGGGVVGLACAHYLSQAGRAVRLIEKDRIGAGASSGNCGLVFVSDIVPLCVPGAVRKEIFGMLRRKSPLYIQPTLDPARIYWLLRFAGMCRTDYLPHAMRARADILHSSALLFDELVRASNSSPPSTSSAACCSCSVPSRPCRLTGG